MSKAFIPLPRQDGDLGPDEIKRRAAAFDRVMQVRRSVRSFSDRPLPMEALEHIVATASSAPSGAHKQPWTFCLVTDPALKHSIREAAEQEEYLNYHGRMGEEWMADLEVFDTDWNKPFLETAPALIVLFKQSYGLRPDGSKEKHYYVNESVGIAAGFLIAAIHQAGLVCLTHTPSPMQFLSGLLKRPENEKAFLLIPVGYPSVDCLVPDLKRKDLTDVLIKYP